ncbi:MAG: hypothetical protein GF317_11020 [Candidatus Lokiarchaeota archaeon]|nr:hypothetical protein [Candidatus Lokiarchaeota archaeon]MBD3200194.1 hypothetical protein [Candidatus Lokiarchaeota archaeon]
MQETNFVLRHSTADSNSTDFKWLKPWKKRKEKAETKLRKITSKVPPILKDSEKQGTNVQFQ